MGQIWPDGKGSERNGEVGDRMAHIYIYINIILKYIYIYISIYLSSYGNNGMPQ